MFPMFPMFPMSPMSQFISYPQLNFDALWNNIIAIQPQEMFLIPPPPLLPIKPPLPPPLPIESLLIEPWLSDPWLMDPLPPPPPPPPPPKTRKRKRYDSLSFMERRKKCAAEGNKKICSEQTCLTQATFGEIGTKKPLYCNVHRHEDHVDVKHNKCLLCNRRAFYSTHDNTKSLYCSIHKTSEHRHAGFRYCDKCDNRAKYGFLLRPKTRCPDHKEAGQVFRTRPTCVVLNCCKHATYTSKGCYLPKHCRMHLLDNEIKIEAQKCARCCNMRAIPDDLWVCVGCYEHQA